MLAGTPCDETLVVAGPEVKKQWYFDASATGSPDFQSRQFSSRRRGGPREIVDSFQAPVAK